jgi:hypothetical protein
MTLHLCKMTPSLSGEAKFVARIGAVVEVMDWEKGTPGYRFIPNVSGKKTSRKIWPTALASIPRWTDNVGYCQLLTDEEYRKRQTSDGA